ncbi:MAG: Hit-like protein involved in cell-cycle regulation [Microgenomates group bacterium Gr01-1014_7]|nr:MAG: Hit-like protein involved in cell-cycle regulation [Microgenomates group bacterium Gr01-1014_7]
MDCLFCKIIKKEIPSNIVAESDSLVVFPDINPAAEVHLLIVPKKHIAGVGEIGEEYAQLLVEIFDTVNILVKKNDLTDKLYRVVVNGGKAQHVPHLHFHLLGGQWKKYV